MSLKGARLQSLGDKIEKEEAERLRTEEGKKQEKERSKEEKPKVK